MELRYLGKFVDDSTISLEIEETVRVSRDSA